MQAFFCGTVLYAQSVFVFCRTPDRAGICITSFSSSEPPASTISTVDSKSSESLFARTHPADPAPTVKKKQRINIKSVISVEFSNYIFLFCVDSNSYKSLIIASKKKKLCVLYCLVLTQDLPFCSRTRYRNLLVNIILNLLKLIKLRMTLKQTFEDNDSSPLHFFY